MFGTRLTVYKTMRPLTVEKHTRTFILNKIKNLFMLSVRISSYGCTWEVWRARKMRKSCTRR